MIFVHGREKPEEVVFLDKEKTLDRRRKMHRFIRENPSTNENFIKCYYYDDKKSS
jgi:hypothetical protein